MFGYVFHGTDGQNHGRKLKILYHQFKKKEQESVGELSEVCSNSCTWHELDDLTSCGPWTNWQDQSQNGLKHVINDQQGCFHIFITQMTIVNIVMWETRHSTVDWVCFKTQTLQATLRTQSQPHEVSCVFLEAEHLSHSVGCARNKHQFLIAPQSLKFFLWMLDYVWIGYLLLIYGTLWSRCYVQPRTTFNLVTLAQGNLGRSNPTKLAQGNLSMFNPSWQFVIPKPRPNMSIEK